MTVSELIEALSGADPEGVVLISIPTLDMYQTTGIATVTVTKWGAEIETDMADLDNDVFEWSDVE